MKRILLYVAIGISALASGGLIAKLQAQPIPTIPAPTATPEVILANTPTQVIVTIPISDPRVIPTGVNLLRVNAMGSRTNLGRMYDDGTHGDAIANDKTLSLRLDLHEPAAAHIQLQISAAFRGLLRRLLSPPATITVLDSTTLEQETLTLLGQLLASQRVIVDHTVFTPTKQGTEELTIQWDTTRSPNVFTVTQRRQYTESFTPRRSVLLRPLYILVALLDSRNNLKAWNTTPDPRITRFEVQPHPGLPGINVHQQVSLAEFSVTLPNDPLITEARVYEVQWDGSSYFLVPLGMFSL
jgi:hypothetical protein